ncbi:hypothetical protein C8J56DRAFT_1100622 [Mycena floridula]|nr:hypothetical protein C8J56DRAFT_1100622 [Mycena floridula]
MIDHMGFMGSAPDEEYMNITWRLSYSGRTPGKFALGEILEMDRRFHRTRANYTMSEHQRAKEHEWSELLNGIFGHRYNEDAHPRRRFFIGLLSGFFGFLISVLEIHCWYTCSSTVSLSVPGTTMSAFSDILEMCIGISRTVAKDKISGVASWAWLLSKRSLTDLLAPLLMLRAISRIDITLFPPSVHFTRGSPSTSYVLRIPNEQAPVSIPGCPGQPASPSSSYHSHYTPNSCHHILINTHPIVGRYDARWGLSVGYLCWEFAGEEDVEGDRGGEEKEELSHEIFFEFSGSPESHG